MALVFADRVKVRSNSTGTGAFTLDETVYAHQGFDAIGDGNETYYGIVDNNGNWEIGRGTYTAPDQLSRDTVQSSSNNDELVNFPAGGKNVFVTFPASLAGSISESVASDSFKTIAVSGQSNVVADSSTDTLTLVAGSNITLTTNATTDTITINSTASGGSSFDQSLNTTDDVAFNTLSANGVVAGVVGGIDDTPLNIETYATDGESTVINSWLLGTDGSLTFPGGAILDTQGPLSNSDFNITIPGEFALEPQTFSFTDEGGSGALKFPDDTFQYTAFNGNRIEVREINFPDGELGDTQGTIALTSTGDTYICTADWEEAVAETGSTSITTNQNYSIGQTGGVSLVWTATLADYAEVQALFEADGYTSGNNFFYSNPDYFTITSEDLQSGSAICTNAGIDNNGDLYFNVAYTSGDSTSLAEGSTATLSWEIPPQQPAIWNQINFNSGTLTNVGYTDNETGYESTLRFAYDFNIDVDNAHLDIFGDGVWDIGSSNFDTAIYSTDYTEENGDPIDLVVSANGNLWVFNRDGTVTFPDGSVQTTAYTGELGARTVEIYSWADFSGLDGQTVTFTSGGIPYQVNNQIDDDPAFGTGSSRIVGVNNNAFLLTVTGVSGVTDLYVEGNIGADGDGIKEVIDITQGIAYNGYHCAVAVTHSGGDPSVNRFIITDTQASASFTTADTDYEDLVVTDLDSATDITILNVYGRAEGYVTGAEVISDPNPNWTSGGYATGVNDISVSIGIDGSGNVTVNSVTSSNLTHTLNEQFTILGSVFGGEDGADDMTFRITTIDAAVPEEDLLLMFLYYVDNYTSLPVANRKTLFTNDLDSIFTATTEGQMLLSTDNISLFERLSYVRNLSGSVSGTGLSIAVRIAADWQDFDVMNAGTGFEIGEEIIIPGSLIGGTSPENDYVLTVGALTGNGGVDWVDTNGTPPTDPIPYSSLIDGSNDEYDDGNYISTNLSRHTFTGVATVPDPDRTGYITLELTSGDLPSFGEVIILDPEVYGVDNMAFVLYSNDTGSGTSELVNNGYTLTLDANGDTNLPGDLLLTSGGSIKDIPIVASTGYIATLAADINDTTPELVDAGGIDGIPTTFFAANDWIGIGTVDIATYPTITFADGTTETITGTNSDAYGDNGFIVFENNVTKTSSQVWPITITSYNYAAAVPAALAVEINEKQWKFDSAGTLTFPDGTEQTTAYTVAAATPLMVAVNTDTAFSYTTDGNTWTTPTYFALGSSVHGIPAEIVQRVALGPNFVVYTGYDADTDTNNRLFYASRVGEDATLVDIPLLTADGSFNWLDIQDGGNYVVAVGNYYDVAEDIRWPVWAYTTTGSTWTLGSVDPAYISFFSGVGAFESVDYDGTGWFIVAAADGAGAGAFYLTNITGTLDVDNFIDFSGNGLGFTPDIESVVWTGSQWVIKYENLSSFAFSDSQNALTASWTAVDLLSVAIDNDFYFGGYGHNESPDQANFYEDAGGNGWYVISGSTGQVLATNDGGDTWIGTIPKPYTGTITGLTAGTQTTITNWEGDFTGDTVWDGSFANIEKITLSSSTPSDYDGSYYAVATGTLDGVTWNEVDGANSNWVPSGTPYSVVVDEGGTEFNIYVSDSGGTPTITNVNIANAGSSVYALLERITINGSALGGTNGVDDFVLIVSGLTGEYNWRLYDTWNAVDGPGTALDSTSFSTFEGATFTLKRGTWIDAVGFGFDQFYVGNDDEELYVSSNLTAWTKKTDYNNEFDFWNDIAYRSEFGGSAPAQYQLTNNGYAATLDGTGGLSLPGRLILPTAYPEDGAFGSPTALDLNKQVQVLSGATNDGSYSLANGVEGQIMYFTPVTNGVFVLVANARVRNTGTGAVEVVNDYSWAVDFDSANEAPRTIAMAIFVNGAWNLTGGASD